MDANRITQRVIGAAIEVHRVLGPGLLEEAYQKALEREFQLQRIPFGLLMNFNVPVLTKGIKRRVLGLKT